MARRSSARLRNRDSSTPQRVSLSHDVPKTPRTAPVSKMAALSENDEMPGSFPRSESPPRRAIASTVSKHTTKTVPVKFDDTTPKRDAPAEPAQEKMHPQKHHQSTVKPREEARWLGFSNMGPYTEPPKKSAGLEGCQGTPTKIAKLKDDVRGSQYQFTFRREQSLELSPEAKKLMSEKREEATKIQEQMTASGEAAEDIDAAIQRKIAQPKGKKSRFSQVHMDQFKKMDSIAGHASSFRTDPSKSKPSQTPTQKDGKAQGVEHTPSKSIKRTASKARLDDGHQASPRVAPASVSKPSATKGPSDLPRSGYVKSLRDQAPQQTSTTKRVRTTDIQDASAARPSSKDGEKRQPATPQPNKIRAEPSYPDLSALVSPTQASLARAASVKSAQTKIPAPHFSRTPVKGGDCNKEAAAPQPPATSLARSPSKTSLFDKSGSGKEPGKASPLLMRSPSKPSPSKKAAHIEEKDTEPEQKSPLLSRSPLKMSVAKTAKPEESHASDKIHEGSLLSRSPVRKPEAAKASEPKSNEGEQSSFIPFLSRSPAKVAFPKNDGDSDQGTPAKSSGGNLMGRFNLLRSSPVKSILRSPQRLYSNDPAKVAAGTHLATPPKQSGAGAASARKRVDFSASTKARQEREKSENGNGMPTKGTTPAHQTSTTEGPTTADMIPVAPYPSLPTITAASPTRDVTPILTPQKRRETAAPRDFTFRAGGHDIVFGPSPHAPAQNQTRPDTSSSSSSQRTSTIRHVSAEPTTTQAQGPSSAVPGSRKRKFTFENARAEDDATATTAGAGSDKENGDGAMDVDDDHRANEEDEGARPAKRAKPSFAAAGGASPVKAAAGVRESAVKRRTTLGVKPKNGEGEKRSASKKGSGTISQARLAALAQPKRRG